ncbi:FAD-dependent oxidoreductase [Pelagicoccus sp. SDUM812002]|uniref:FAD-dependent oxidoreductase n=1 Tax=Pelagicoccus sp. SDUM812002 TaxID=3041266 RepID=UPI00280E92AA|nr:FAD-dependent oxidoreductase [Pelagicoccus sp. SDUM812002]MDQ8184751.1 FAD-dependent oxidoreductase [Pelagicoccus sp. SDUM812002]
MSSNFKRREFLRLAGLSLGLGMSRSLVRGADDSEVHSVPREHIGYPQFGKLPLVRASQDRIVKETVGLRPFRDSGPNLGHERIGDKSVFHNYGHGGSGWSLSWGTSAQVTTEALTSGAQQFAVIGCGAIGLTSAILLQRAGKIVTIYCKERHPNITSSVATGVWSPDSRICLKDHATDAFAAWWNTTCRTSFKLYQSFLGLPGSPIEWVDSYAVSNQPWDAERPKDPNDTQPEYGHFRDYVQDLTPRFVDLDKSQNPFREPYARKGSRMIFNISTYHQTLLREFTSLGGHLVHRDFQNPAQFAELAEPVVINATGLGSKTLFDDKQMHPVRGQLTVLIPQPELNYSFSNNDAYVIPRRDGVVIGSSKNGIIDSTNLEVDPEQSFNAVAAIAQSMTKSKIAKA